MAGRIESFEAGDVKIMPSEAGSAAMREAGGVARQFANQSGAQLQQGAQALGRGIHAIGSGIGDLYDDAQGHEDTLAATEASKKSADFDFQMHDKLNHIMDPEPDPNDPTGQKMIQKDPNNARAYIGGFLDDWWNQRQELRGQITNEKALKKFDSETESGYHSISNKAYAIYGEVNYAAVRDNIVKATNSRAGVVFNDPTQIDAMLKQTHEDLQSAFSGTAGITPAQRMQLTTETDRAASRVIIERGIDALARTPGGRQKALDLINSNKYDEYIGEDKDKLLSHVRTMDRADRADAEAARKQQGEAEKDRALAQTDKYIQDAVSGDPKKKLTDVWTDPTYNNRPDLRQQAVHVFETMRKMQQGSLVVDPVTSHKTTLDMMHRMTLPDNDPQKIRDPSELYKAFGQEQLSKQDFTFLQGEFKRINGEGGKELAQSRKDFLTAYANTIDPFRMGQPGGSALGNENRYKFEQFAISEEKRLQAAGEDPKSLYQPGSKNYLGNADTLSRFHTPIDQANKFNDAVNKSITEAIQKVAPQRINMQNPSIAPGGKPLDIAQRYLGMDENRDHEALTAFLNHAGNGGYLDPAKTAWCARYVNSVLATAGIQGSNSDAAKSFLHVGQPVNPQNAAPVDIIVFNRGNDPAKGHVGFIKSVNGDDVVVLSGNHNNQVALGHYSLSSAVGIRRVGQMEVGGAIPGPLGTSGQEYAVARIPQTAPTRVTSPEEAYKLPGGTRIILPDGRYGTVPYPQVPISR